MAHTNTAGPTAWWSLTFQKSFKIESIKIYGREDCCEDQLNGAKVYIGEELVGTVEHESGKVVYEFLGLEMAGDVIKIYGGEKELALVEVQVFVFVLLGEFYKFIIPIIIIVISFSLLQKNK